jgi:hypothetical protein
MEIHSFTVLRARSPKSRCHQGWIPPKTLGEGLACLFQPLVATRALWLVDASLCQVTVTSVYLSHWIRTPPTAA